MGSGFVRRFASIPSTEVINAIEGVVLVDLAPPAKISGTGTGVAALVGEFADMRYAVSVTTAGVVSTSAQPVEIFSAQDLLAKVGGFDDTLGEFGVSGGNGFCEVRGKFFSRLVCVPVNLCSDRGVRVWRDLPTNTSATNATPVVPMQAVSVAAAREFKSGSNRVRLGTRVDFTGAEAYHSGTDGSVTAAGAPAATQSFTAASGAFVAKGAKEGDLLVVGVISAAGAQGANARTYRIAAVTSATVLSVEKMDGTTFDWTTGATLAWRLHKASDADSGKEHQFTEAGGYLIPARPLDATIAGATVLTPTVAPAAGTATTWDPLSGLGAATIPTDGLTYTAGVQAPNAVSASALDVLYQSAIDGLLGEDLPAREVNIAWSARLSTTINAYGKTHVTEANVNGVPRVWVTGPTLTTTSIDTAIGDAAPGVGAQRDERVIYTWPGARAFIREAVNVIIKTADGATTTDGLLDLPGCSWLASALSLLAPERNPGEVTATTKLALDSVKGLQRSVTGLKLSHYVRLKARGVCALRIDRTDGPLFQSGMTSSLTSGETDIARRRFADFVQDSISQRLNRLAKLPLTQALKDTIDSELFGFFNELLSPDNKLRQRIAGFQLNTETNPDLEEQNIYLTSHRVRMLGRGDSMVVVSEVGPTVRVSASGG